MLLFGGFFQTEAPKNGLIQQGKASYYATKFEGCRTTSGERVNSQLLSGAHKTLPFNTLVEVTNLANSRSVIVRINDRGPHVRGRIIDLSRSAAHAIGMLGKGLANVKIRVVGKNRLLASLDPPLTLDGRSPLLPSLMPVQ